MPRPRFIVIVLVLLALNYVSVALLGPGKERSIDVPYNPTFRAQVEAGNVERIVKEGYRFLMMAPVQSYGHFTAAQKAVGRA